MSLATWKAEFYQVEAKDVKPEDAVQHSLTKWVGLRKENLSRHGLVAKRKRIEEEFNSDSLFFVDGCSCALCFHYESDYNNRHCQKCPLYKALGNKRCDQSYWPNESDISPYLKWTRENDPKPMIAALVAAQQYEQSQIQQPSQQSV